MSNNSSSSTVSGTPASTDRKCTEVGSGSCVYDEEDCENEWPNFVQEERRALSHWLTCSDDEWKKLKKLLPSSLQEYLKLCQTPTQLERAQTKFLDYFYLLQVDLDLRDTETRDESYETDLHFQTQTMNHFMDFLNLLYKRSSVYQVLSETQGWADRRTENNATCREEQVWHSLLSHCIKKLETDDRYDEIDNQYVNDFVNPGYVVWYATADDTPLDEFKTLTRSQLDRRHTPTIWNLLSDLSWKWIMSSRGRADICFCSTNGFLNELQQCIFQEYDGGYDDILMEQIQQLQAESECFPWHTKYFLQWEVWFLVACVCLPDISSELQLLLPVTVLEMEHLKRNSHGYKRTLRKFHNALYHHLRLDLDEGYLLQLRKFSLQDVATLFEFLFMVQHHPAKIFRHTDQFVPRHGGSAVFAKTAQHCVALALDNNDDDEYPYHGQKKKLPSLHWWDGVNFDKFVKSVTQDEMLLYRDNCLFSCHFANLFDFVRGAFRFQYGQGEQAFQVEGVIQELEAWVETGCKKYDQELEGAWLATKVIGEDLICPITRDLPLDPVLAGDRHIYERSAIQQHIKVQVKQRGQALRSPRTNLPMSERLEPLVEVKNHVETLVSFGVIAGDLADKWKENKRNDLIKEATDGNGNTEAMVRLADNYEYGKQGFPKDIKLAYEWYKKAHRAGNVHATANLGALLMKRLGLPEGTKDGERYLTLAAFQSNLAAQWMGMAYAEGRYGVSVNHDEAIYLLKRCLVLDGTLNEYGKEVAKNKLRELGVESEDS